MKRVISSESAVYGTEICFKRQKMIDGEYDLKKLLELIFLIRILFLTGHFLRR